MVKKNNSFNAKFEIKSKSAFRNWVWVVVFAIVFAQLESAVVVYLREIYFKAGFSSPLVVKQEDGKHVIDPLIRIELVREIATVIMLVSVGWIAGRNRFQNFYFFIIAFGIWDIFYYIWLYIMVSWPESLMAWDLLFYVPLSWVDPVIAPVLIAIAMVLAGSLFIYNDEKGYDFHWRWYDMVVATNCGLLIVLAFCWDWKNIIQIPGDIERTGTPNPFAWLLQLPVYLFSIAYFALRLRQIIITNQQISAGELNR